MSACLSTDVPSPTFGTRLATREYSEEENIDVATLVIGSLGIFVALRNQGRQLNAQMFIEFSNRFQQLLRTLKRCDDGGG